MSDKKQMSDKEAFESLIRAGRRQNKISWVPSTSLDPADRAADRDALNRAIRRAGGKDAPEPVSEKFPWTSLKDGVGDKSGGT